jgi:hypothetical protein
MSATPVTAYPNGALETEQYTSIATLIDETLQLPGVVDILDSNPLDEPLPINTLDGSVLPPVSMPAWLDVNDELITED